MLAADFSVVSAPVPCQPTSMLRTTLPPAVFGAVLLLAVTRGPGVGAQRPATGMRPSHRAVLTFIPRGARVDTIPLYTDEQAASGAALFAKVCVECHELSDYTGEKFRAKWSGQTMYDLYEQIRTKMPDDKPGTLSREEYADALAYILKQNKIPAGSTKIAPDSAAMSAVKLDLPPVSPP